MPYLQKEYIRLGRLFDNGERHTTERAESENTKSNETVITRRTSSENWTKKNAPSRDAPAAVCSRGQKRSTTIACTPGIHTKKAQSREDGNLSSIERIHTVKYIHSTCHLTLSSPKGGDESHGGGGGGKTRTIKKLRETFRISKRAISHCCIRVHACINSRCWPLWEGKRLPPFSVVGPGSPAESLHAPPGQRSCRTVRDRTPDRFVPP